MDTEPPLLDEKELESLLRAGRFVPREFRNTTDRSGEIDGGLNLELDRHGRLKRDQLDRRLINLSGHNGSFAWPPDLVANPYARLDLLAGIGVAKIYSVEDQARVYRAQQDAGYDTVTPRRLPVPKPTEEGYQIREGRAL